MFRIITDESSEEVTVSILSITKLKGHQSGNYYCKASNTVGTSEINIIIQGKYYFLFNEYSFSYM